MVSGAGLARVLALALLTAPLAPIRAAVAPAAEVASEASLQAADPQHGRILYLEHCQACHGARAWGDGPREIPALAGQRAAYLEEQLRRFATGARPGSDMHGPAMRDTLRATDVNRPPAIRDLATFLAQAAAPAQVEQGEGGGLPAGKRAYLRVCAGCHGEDGSGAAEATPRIGGQHFRYLLARLREFGTVHAGQLADSGLSAAEQESVADYLSRLVPPRRAPPAPP